MTLPPDIRFEWAGDGPPDRASWEAALADALRGRGRGVVQFSRAADGWRVDGVWLTPPGLAGRASEQATARNYRREAIAALRARGKTVVD
jgi:hypothetical protein